MKKDENSVLRASVNALLVVEVLEIILLLLGMVAPISNSTIVKVLAISIYIGFLMMALAFLLVLFLAAVRIFRLMSVALNRGGLDKEKRDLTLGAGFPMFRLISSLTLFFVMYLVFQLLAASGK